MTRDNRGARDRPITKAAFYRVGDSPIATDSFLRAIGLEPIRIPPVTAKTISRGVSISPEFSCFPFKVSVGMLDSASESGAKIFIMLGGRSQSACQLADFAQAQRYIMEKTDRKIEIVSIENVNPAHMVALFKKYNPRLTLRQATKAMLLMRKKLFILDALEGYYRDIYLSTDKSHAEDFKRTWGKKLSGCDSLTQLYALHLLMKNDYRRFPNASPDKRVKIAIIGDVYCLNENAINNNIYEKLLDLGVFIHQSITFSDIVGGPTIKGAREMILDNGVGNYLKHPIAGFARHTIKEAIRFAEEGYDGLIHIYPFTCMPEITVRNILPRLSRDYSIPILYLPMDEQTGDAGFTTRIEAFVDLIKMKKARR